jgi:hypothetical protein
VLPNSNFAVAESPIGCVISQAEGEKYRLFQKELYNCIPTVNVISKF